MLQRCKRPRAKGEGARMLCQMPVLSLPYDLTEQLENSESGQINDTQGPGVAVYLSSDGRTRADIYIGLKLDGLKRYRNISSVKPTIKMQFAVQPSISCQSDDMYFNPRKQKLITFRVICRQFDNKIITST